MKKICVAGHANYVSVTEKTKEFADIIADWILKNKYQATTGGCIGIPELVANKVAENGGDVLAYSPGENVEEHITEFGFAENKNIKMKYLPHSNSSRNAKFLVRSIDLIEDADLVICFNGTWGTLSELVFAVMCSKQILLLNIDGNNKVIKQVYDLMQTINLFDWKEKLVEVKSTDELKEKLKLFEKTGKI